MMQSETPKSDLDIAALREQLQSMRGQLYWRSLDSIADTDTFRAFVDREFPHGASELNDPVSRRTFLKLMGASIALAGLTGCIRQPQERIAPYTQAPPEMAPGVPLFYATALNFGGFASGVLVRSNDGRPTKVEGNPNHPASLGATDIFAQAEILSLYDPDRSQVVLDNGTISTWDLFLQALTPVLGVQRTINGAGLRILSQTVTSPTLASQIQAVLEAYPEAKWYQYEPVSRDHSRAGARLAFGEVVETRYAFDKAKVILALDADFLADGPGHVRYEREFADGRRVRANRREMNRLYVIEPAPTITGITADHRLPLQSSRIEAAVRFIARELGVPDVAESAETPHEEWLAALARDLRANPGASLVVAGESQPPIVHALVHAINAELDNIGVTVEYTDPVEANPVDQMVRFADLIAEMRSGQIDVLVVLGGNPVYDAPANLNFAEAFAQVKLRIVWGAYDDETAARANWHIPAAHDLESWSDLRSYDGTVSIVQPLILPLYEGKSAHEVVAALQGRTTVTGYDLVLEHWRDRSSTDDFDTFWRKALHDGVVPDTRFEPKPVKLQTGFGAQLPTAPPTGLEIVFQTDPTIWDGRYTNNGWLQELPKPITKLTWDNAALVGPSTAERLGLRNEDVVELRLDGRSVLAPIWITPGVAPDTVAVQFGYGRSHTGRVGEGAGFNAYALRTSTQPWFAGNLEVVSTGNRYQLVSTQDHGSMEGRDIVRVGEFAEFREDPSYLFKEIYLEEYGAEKKEYDSLMSDFTYTENAWGMTIDLNVCTGCNACTVACQAENNIPIVGKSEVGVGREMHWIRIDRYFAGDNLDNPATYVQPMACVHCEKAPCELVCPVAATNHDHEGINNMVYNRCVGTKYCSNNCPYKVRRFNFLQYVDTTTESLKLMRNPEVTVRNRGVMEKCTYCIQRISAVRIASKKEGNRPIRDGEVVTACQQVCPTQAIAFGDTKNPESQVAKIKTEPLNYTLLDELNTIPRTSYLARLRNPNPELEGQGE